MFYAYVLRSVEHDFYYKGHCCDLAKRLQQHNSGMTVSLRPYLPVILIYYESFETEEQAIIREKYFKTAAGRRYLAKRLV